ncbi:MAG: methyltransferase domain-containing protein [Alphaproteobacteria bacterium]|nr:methyltransferase domain-containing protein [Alphaproteobacteria bacterium]
MATSESIDFATTALDYERFRQLAKNPNLSPEEKIAFPSQYRVGYEDMIFAEILGNLLTLKEPNKTWVDIGCGCGGVTDRVKKFAAQENHNLVLVDSKEMLDLNQDQEGMIKIAGKYPEIAQDVFAATGAKGADAILCYSVLHYVYVDTNLFAFLDHLIDLLAPRGAALIGDIPNVSKRKRFFSSEAGIAFHKAFQNTDEPPRVEHLVTEHDNIDDAVLAGLVRRAQAAGCNAYIVPQNDALPMANRRDDLLIRRP